MPCQLADGCVFAGLRQGWVLPVTRWMHPMEAGLRWFGAGGCAIRQVRRSGYMPNVEVERGQSKGLTSATVSDHTPLPARIATIISFRNRSNRQRLRMRQQHSQSRWPLRVDRFANLTQRLLRHACIKNTRALSARFYVAVATWRSVVSLLRKRFTSAGPISSGVPQLMEAKIKPYPVSVILL